MKDVLFIGGCADGERLKDPGHKHWLVRDPVEFVAGPGCVVVPVKHSHYIRKVFEDTVFYHEQSLSLSDVLRLLITNYRKQEP